jgi:hypothetical protein
VQQLPKMQRQTFSRISNKHLYLSLILKILSLSSHFLSLPLQNSLISPNVGQQGHHHIQVSEIAIRQQNVAVLVRQEFLKLQTPGTIFPDRFLQFASQNAQNFQHFLVLKRKKISENEREERVFFSLLLDWFAFWSCLFLFSTVDF